MSRNQSQNPILQQLGDVAASTNEKYACQLVDVANSIKQERWLHHFKQSICSFIAWSTIIAGGFLIFVSIFIYFEFQYLAFAVLGVFSFISQCVVAFILQINDDDVKRALEVKNGRRS